MKEKKTQEKSGWGGARKGAGRPKTSSKLYSFRAPEDIAREVDKAQNRTEFIRTCMTLGVQAMKNRNPLEESTDTLVREMFDAQDEKNQIYVTEAEIACGLPAEAFNAAAAPESLVSLLGIDQQYMYVMTARGDSMIDAGINSGDKLIIDTRPRIPTPDQIAVCQLNGEYTLKHFRLEKGQGLLIPENPNYPTIQITPGEDDFHIWGVLYMVLKFYS